MQLHGQCIKCEIYIGQLQFMYTSVCPPPPRMATFPVPRTAKASHTLDLIPADTPSIFRHICSHTVRFYYPTSRAVRSISEHNYISLYIIFTITFCTLNILAECPPFGQVPSLSQASESVPCQF